MVVLEAMAMGCPVVVSDIPSLRELVGPGEHGDVVPPGDADALAIALERLCADPDRRAALGAAAAARARARFGAPAAAERIARLLQGVAKRS